MFKKIVLIILNFIKRLFCKHKYKYLGKLCGVEDTFECTKCGKRKTAFYRATIERMWKNHEIELDFKGE